MPSRYDAGRAAWPEIALDPETFARFLAERPAVDEHAAELFLVCACVAGDAGARALFDRQYLGPIARYLGRVDTAPAFVDEVRQVLRVKLLVGAPGTPIKLAEYSGRGPLTAWVRVAALRTALDLRRRGRERVGRAEDFSPAAVSDGADLELEYIQGRYREEFQTAFREALAGLADDDRLVLRLHYVDGLTMEKIGALYRMGRSSAQRRVAAVREQLLAEVGRRLRERLRLSEADFRSLAGVLRSRLHVSLSALL